MLEESLFILEECLQQDNSLLLDSSVISSHVKTLKYFYAPEFEIDYSESGSYFYAALSSMNKCYIGSDAKYCLPLSSRFIKSLENLLHVSRLSLRYRTNKVVIVEDLLSLSALWKLQNTLDMQSLILQSLAHMRSELYLDRIDITHG